MPIVILIIPMQVVCTPVMETYIIFLTIHKTITYNKFASFLVGSRYKDKEFKRSSKELTLNRSSLFIMWRLVTILDNFLHLSSFVFLSIFFLSIMHFFPFGVLSIVQTYPQDCLVYSQNQSALPCDPTLSRSFDQKPHSSHYWSKWRTEKRGDPSFSHFLTICCDVIEQLYWITICQKQYCTLT